MLSRLRNEWVNKQKRNLIMIRSQNIVFKDLAQFIMFYMSPNINEHQG